MSRRWEGRESDSKRYRSKFDREPSPKRSRRDGKPATERSAGKLHSEVTNSSDRDQKHNQRLRDALPLEAPPAPESKTENGSEQLPRSYFQHDERDRRHGRGAPTGLKDSKDQRSEKASKRIETRGLEQRGEKGSETRRDTNHAWRHDGFFEMDRDKQPPMRKRPSFRERKDEVAPKNAERTGDKSLNSEIHLEKEQREPRGSFRRERDSNRRELQRGNFLERDRYRGRERFNGRRGYQPGGDGRVRVEKWKHDLYEEDNKSPIRKNEDDYVAKVEALLAS